MEGSSHMSGCTQSSPVVVLGFGAAAVSAVMALRAAGYSGHIEVVTKEAAEPYSPVLTSYYAGGRVSREQCFVWADEHPRTMVDAVHEHACVESLDTDAHEVRFSGGQALRYSKLLIATGARPVAPGFPRDGATGAHMLRTLEDAERLRSTLADARCRRVLICGTSMVGLKVLEACLDRGVQPTLLGRSAHILRASTHPAVAERFECLLAERSVELRLGMTVADAAWHGEAAGCEIVYNTGATEQFDAVVLAQGTAANLEFLDDGQIDIDQGVLVDGFMHASARDVFAAGDVAQGLDLSCGKKRVIGLWQNAVQQGRCAGRTMAAELTGRVPAVPFAGSIPSNVIHVRDILFASAGSVEKGGGVRIDVQESEGTLLARAYKDMGGDERLVGFNMLTTAASGAHAVRAAEMIGAYRSEVKDTFLELTREG